MRRAPSGAALRGAALALVLALLPGAAAADEALVPVPRIANGVPTTAWPEVGVLLLDGGQCSATLVGCRTALTAAHCVCTGDGTGAPCGDGGRLRDPGNLLLFLPRAGVFGVRSLAIPPNYAFGAQGDLAVLDLGGPVRAVRPRAINEQQRPPLGSLGTIVGFGSTTQIEGDGGIQRAGAVVTASCANVSSATHLCWNFVTPPGPAGTQSNTCPGDSGGPLLVDLGAGSVLAGVHSGGFGLTCQGSGSSFDTDVFVARAWLRDTAGVELDDLGCGGGPHVGEPGAGLVAFAGALGAPVSHSFAVPPDTKVLRVGLSAATSVDADLYLRFGAPASTTVFTCASASDGSFEYCEIADPAPGTWHVLLVAFAGSGAYQLTATLLPEDPAPPPLAPGDVVTANFTGQELVQVDLASGERAITASRLRGFGPDLAGPEDLALDADGSILVANPFLGNLLRMDPATGDRTVVSGCADAACAAQVGTGPAFLAPRFLARAPGGQLFVADRSLPGVYAIVRVDPATGNRTVVSGCADAACTTVVGGGAAIGRLFGIALEPTGGILVADGLAVHRIDAATGDRTLLSGCPDAGCAMPAGGGPAFGEPIEIAVHRSGALYVTYRREDFAFGALRRIDPATGDRTLVSGCEDLACNTVRGAGPRFVDLFGIAFDRDGSLLVSDGRLDALLRVDPESGDRTLLSGCADARCTSAAGAGPRLTEPLGFVVVPEPAAGGAAAVLSMLAIAAARRRRAPSGPAGATAAAAAARRRCWPPAASPPPRAGAPRGR